MSNVPPEVGAVAHLGEMLASDLRRAAAVRRLGELFRERKRTRLHAFEALRIIVHNWPDHARELWEGISLALLHSPTPDATARSRRRRKTIEKQIRDDLIGAAVEDARRAGLTREEAARQISEAPPPAAGVHLGPDSIEAIYDRWRNRRHRTFQELISEAVGIPKKTTLQPPED